MTSIFKQSKPTFPDDAFRIFCISTFMIVAGSFNIAHAAGDVEAGAKIFKQCGACHKIGEGAENSTGPVLTGVIGRQAGTFEGYRYGKSTKAAGDKGLIWSEELVFEYLENPRNFLRAYLETRKAKSKMKFKLKKEEDRRNVAAYLATFSTMESMAPEVKPEKASMKADGEVITEFAGKICVTNESDATLLFVAEANNGLRSNKTLAPKQTHCVASADANGTIGVFENEDALEGCSRLAKTGTPERLVSYTPFDNCAWGS
ncbi:MAG: c-type cytochrome [Rhizobiaceae bacterium]|nr:c-type cytochrome [Rhizobiaceae bacterium]